MRDGHFAEVKTDGISISLHLVRMGNTTVTLSGVLVRGGDIVLPTGESKVVSP